MEPMEDSCYNSKAGARMQPHFFVVVGKSATTSVPSISIKFHANAEQLEEIHTDDDESASTCTGGSTDKRSSSDRSTVPSSTPPVTNISNPLKYLPKLVKRSTSVDVSSTLSQQQDKQTTDSSPPASDPWRFFSDIKGKITKSVEEKITEIKSRTQEEGSPHHKQKALEQPKTTKDSKENSSVSDSEDLSESSISRTCGIISTTEGRCGNVERRGHALDREREEEGGGGAPRHSAHFEPAAALPLPACGWRGHKEAGAAVAAEEAGTVKINDLSKLYNINAEKVDQVLPEQDYHEGAVNRTGGSSSGGVEEVESAVDALDETASFDAALQKYDNIEVDQRENVVTVKEVTGKDIREDFLHFSRDDKPRTLFAPSGFVDLRVEPTVVTPNTNNSYLWYAMAAVASVSIYYLIYQICPFFSGLALGLMVSFLLFELYTKLNPLPPPPPAIANVASKQPPPPTKHCDNHRILEIQAVKEYQPLFKYEGWVNEYPEPYDPHSYHISRTQSVWVRLQGNLLRLSHAKNHKVAKRAMWNEPATATASTDGKQSPPPPPPPPLPQTAFTHHRIYNMIGAKVTLLPLGLAKKRHWSKKYPICITLAKDQLYFDNQVVKSDIEKEKSDCKETKEKDKEKEKLLSVSPKERKSFGRFRRKDYTTMAQRFSRLTEDEDIDLDSDSRASTPSADVSDIAEFPPIPDEESSNQNKSPNIDSLNEEWSICSPTKEEADLSEVKIFLFGRTDREKEDWFRRLTTATHKEEAMNTDDLEDASNNTYLDYIKFMHSFKPPRKSPKHGKGKSEQQEDAATSEDRQPEPSAEGGGGGPEADGHGHVLWLNTLIGRVLFDCMRDETFIRRVKERIQRKLSTIKLPNFIEELLISELSLGRTSPMICKAGKPVLDDRGVWIDLGIAYEGDVLLTLQTKLNLMRLKNPQTYGGETTGSGGSPTVTPSSGGGKKFIRMVDRLAESKFFQAATENRYIKKAMEGVSTELRLTVEVKSLTGTLVLNIPPPPSDRIWVGFRPLPEILLSARPIVGERNISYFMVTSWIEKKLLQEFQKILVVPNMEDFIIPVMNPKLPD
nr:unnamed protein product [Callosobruchus analis]